MAASVSVNAKSCSHCFIDVDIDDHRSKLARVAAFVDATDSRYGFSSKELRNLGGSELARVENLMESDHEWNDKYKKGIELRPPIHGMRIVIKLFWDTSPLACENFATLCTNGTDTLYQLHDSTAHKSSTTKKMDIIPIGASGKPLTYKNSTFHRILPSFIAQGGDFVFHNGSGGECVFHGKKTFKDERLGLGLHHDRRGLVSMGNSGRKNSNTSQFFITLGGEKEGVGQRCDGKHVVFGEVISGWEVVDALERAGSDCDEGEPSVTVRVSECGAYHPLHTPGAGFWYDRPDESFLGYSPVFMVRPRVAILTPTAAIYDKFRKLMGEYVAPVSVVVIKEGGEECSDDEINGDSFVIALQDAMEQLSKFMVDVVLVAPVYSELVQSRTIEIPASWVAEMDGWQRQYHLGEKMIALEEVIIAAKPVDALSKLKEESWLRRQSSWQLDGLL